MKEQKNGNISEIIFYNETNFYAILLFETSEEQFFAVGNIPNPKLGRSYELIGEWTTHPKYGEQFKFSSAKELEPTTKDGIAAFLASGMIKGVGVKMAKAITNHFGDETLNIIRETPHRLTEVPGIGSAKAQAIIDGYREHREYADVVLALSAFDISPLVCMKLYKSFGADAVNVVRENPYRLIDEIYGIGFKKADKIAGSVGFSPDSPYRIESAVIYLLEELAGSGDTYAPEKEFIENAAQFLDVQREQVAEGCFDLAMNGTIVKEILDGQSILQLYTYNRAEKAVAGKIYELCESVLKGLAVKPLDLLKKAEADSGKELSERQREAVLSALNNGVNVITGGPGTGKTTIINALLAIMQGAGLKTVLAAPTGRAAKRMQSAANHPATTIHRLLEYAYVEGEDRMVFGRNKENPLDAACIIIDEVSMVDILLMEALMNAVKPGTRVILVGDADQLPPVGAGSVLKDVLACESIHSSRLTEIFRQAGESAIVINAHAVNHGEYPTYNKKDSDFFLLQAGSESEIADKIIELSTKRLPAYYSGIDPYTDIQVLTPTRKGALGSIELNKKLQAALNPPDSAKAEKQIGDRIFREGDKVMQIKNNYSMEWKNRITMLSGTGVFNGDMGIVDTIDEENGKIGVLFDDEKYVVYDAVTAAELESAFALTVHKSQGSEFAVVIMPAANFPPMLSTRNLLYTAITRAKSGVVLVGSPVIVNRMVDNKSTARRCSGLRSRLDALFLNSI